MQRLVELLCKNCGVKFMPKSGRNIFCTRKCFKQDFHHRKKAEELSLKKNPTFTCPTCGQKITLEFDPVKESFRWLHYKCAGCNTLMIHVSESIVTKDEPTS